MIIEFINWITGKHEEFRKSVGLDKYTPYTKEQEKMFLKFISGSRWVQDKIRVNTPLKNFFQKT